MNGGLMVPLDLGVKSVAAFTLTAEKSSCTVLSNLGDETVMAAVAWPGTMRFAYDTGEGGAQVDGNTLTLPPKSGCIFH